VGGASSRDHRHDPLYAAFVLLGVIGMFKPYPTLADPGLFLSLIALFPETYPRP
jgi:phosphatidylinositol glycan class U